MTRIEGECSYTRAKEKEEEEEEEEMEIQRRPRSARSLLPSSLSFRQRMAPELLN
jgi:hypothetical protein